MNSAQISDHIYNQFNEACVDMFSDLDCSIQATDADMVECDGAPVCDIDAGNDDLEVRLLLKFPFAVLAMTYPAGDVMEVDDAKLEDWLGEFANQLIGRLKNKLIKNEVYLKLGLPETHFDAPAEDLIPAGFQHQAFYFDIDNETIECHVLIDVINENLHAVAESDDDEGIEEGELELF